MLKLHKRFPLGNTGLALRVAYDCPLEELDHAFEPPARLLVRSILLLMALSCLKPSCMSRTANAQPLLHAGTLFGVAAIQPVSISRQAVCRACHLCTLHDGTTLWRDCYDNEYTHMYTYRTAKRPFVMHRLDNQAGSGIHVGPSGVEFDERVLALGANAEARFGASVGFPRQLPVVEGQQLFNWNIHRLGLKTRW